MFADSSKKTAMETTTNGKASDYNDPETHNTDQPTTTAYGFDKAHAAMSNNDVTESTDAAKFTGEKKGAKERGTMILPEAVSQEIDAATKESEEQEELLSTSEDEEEDQTSTDGLDDLDKVVERTQADPEFGVEGDEPAERIAQNTVQLFLELLDHKDIARSHITTSMMAACTQAIQSKWCLYILSDVFDKEILFQEARYSVMLEYDSHYGRTRYTGADRLRVELSKSDGILKSMFDGADWTEGMGENSLTSIQVGLSRVRDIMEEALRSWPADEIEEAAETAEKGDIEMSEADVTREVMAAAGTSHFTSVNKRKAGMADASPHPPAKRTKISAKKDTSVADSPAPETTPKRSKRGGPPAPIWDITEKYRLHEFSKHFFFHNYSTDERAAIYNAWLKDNAYRHVRTWHAIDQQQNALKKLHAHDLGASLKRLYEKEGKSTKQVVEYWNQTSMTLVKPIVENEKKDSKKKALTAALKREAANREAAAANAAREEAAPNSAGVQAATTESSATATDGQESSGEVASCESPSRRDCLRGGRCWRG